MLCLFFSIYASDEDLQEYFKSVGLILKLLFGHEINFSEKEFGVKIIDFCLEGVTPPKLKIEQPINIDDDDMQGNLDSLDNKLDDSGYARRIAQMIADLIYKGGYNSKYFAELFSRLQGYNAQNHLSYIENLLDLLVNSFYEPTGRALALLYLILNYDKQLPREEWLLLCRIQHDLQNISCPEELEALITDLRSLQDRNNDNKSIIQDELPSDYDLNDYDLNSSKSHHDEREWGNEFDLNLSWVQPGKEVDGFNGYKVRIEEVYNSENENTPEKLVYYELCNLGLLNDNEANFLALYDMTTSIKNYLQENDDEQNNVQPINTICDILSNFINQLLLNPDNVKDPYMLQFIEYFKECQEKPSMVDRDLLGTMLTNLVTEYMNKVIKFAVENKMISDIKKNEGSYTKLENTIIFWFTNSILPEGQINKTNRNYDALPFNPFNEDLVEPAS